MCVCVCERESIVCVCVCVHKKQNNHKTYYNNKGLLDIRLNYLKIQGSEIWLKSEQVQICIPEYKSHLCSIIADKQNGTGMYLRSKGKCYCAIILGKVKTLGEFAVHRKFELIRMGSVASFSEDEQHGG